MPKLTIHVDRNGSTVREMRRELARLLSPLRGEQEVSFTFRAVLPTYRTGRWTFGKLARPEND